MRHRLPGIHEILPVYSTITTAVFSWSIFAFIWKLPSWMLSLNLKEILSILFYTLSVDLLESLFWLALILGIGMLLPARALKDQFAVRATIISFLVLSSLALLVNLSQEWGEKLFDYSIVWIGGTILLSIFMAYLSAKFSFLANGALWVADRLMIFLYLYIPLSVISLIVVLSRNIF